MNKQVSISFVFDFAPSLTKFSIFDIGEGKSYIDSEAFEQNFESKYEGFFKEQLEALIQASNVEKVPVSVYFSGTFLTYLEIYHDQMLHKLKDAVNEGNLSLLAGTYYHSMSSIYSKDIFVNEVKLHQEKLRSVFDKTPNHFYNTENIYYNDLAISLNELGYTSTFGGSIDWYLGENKDERIFHSKYSDQLHILLVDSDEGKSIFENEEMSIHFLQIEPNGMTKLGGVKNIIDKTQSKAKIASIENLTKATKSSPYHVNNPIMGSSWGLTLASFHDSALQQQAIKQFYKLEGIVTKTNSQKLIQEWLVLGNINFFLSISTELNEDTLAYDTYASFINILNDIELAAEKLLEK
jgi:hypothetical protein